MLYKVSQFIVVFALSIVLLTVHVNAQSTLNDQQETQVQEVIRDQLSAFQNQDFDRAFFHAGPTIKQIFQTTERFVGMVKNGYAPLYNPEYFAFSRSIEQGGSFYQEVLVTDQTGKQWQAVYTLKQQDDGSWKITGVKMEPTTGAAT